MKPLYSTLLMGLITAALLSGCAGSPSPAASAASAAPVVSAPAETAAQEASSPASAAPADQEPAEVEAAETAAPAASADVSAPVTAVQAVTGGILDGSTLFTQRDLTQSADLSAATAYSVSDGEDLHIQQEGVYVLSGAAENVTVYVEAPADAKVQLVLDGLTLHNADLPCIYVTEADKVFVTTTQTENALTVSGPFQTGGSTKADGAIFSKSDLVLGGLGTLRVSSTDNGIVSKDDLKITGGAYEITADSKGLEANDSIAIAAGDLQIQAGDDGIHAANDEDSQLGYVYICGGDIRIDAGDDGIQASSVMQLDGGAVTVSGTEGLEATYLQIHDGTITVSASDDGINAADKSPAYSPTVEILGGTITVTMAQGDTDAIDSNGDLIISGGTLDITGRSAFDFDGQVQFTGGTVTVNGQQVDSISNRR